LSLVAATAVDPGVVTNVHLQTLLESGQHPFSGFVDPGNFQKRDALDVLCSSDARTEIESRYEVSCAQRPQNSAGVRGNVVLIGDELAGVDRHRLFGEDIAGVYLQANYIESLLSGRYLKRLGTAWDIGILALWLGLLYLAFWEKSPEVALLWSAAAAIVIAAGIAALVRLTGSYPLISAQMLGLAALPLRYAEARGHAVKQWLTARH
jgi:CHASE2 domain-containing sensor protein